MPRRVPRKPRPKKTNVPKGYDSAWEYNIHQTILQDWKHHWDKLDYVVQHTYEPDLDRKSTRLNSSHGYISYAVFCLKKKNNHR